AGDAADLLERTGIQQSVDSLAYRQAAAFVLARDPFLAAHFARERLALAKFGKLGFPADLDGLLSVDAVVHPFPVPMGVCLGWSFRRLAGAAQRCRISSAPSPVSAAPASRHVATNAWRGCMTWFTPAERRRAKL